MTAQITQALERAVEAVTTLYEQDEPPYLVDICRAIMDSSPQPQAEQPAPAYGCHCDLEPGMQPDGCVIGTERQGGCVYAEKYTAKEQCQYWQPIVMQAKQPQPAPNVPEGWRRYVSDAYVCLRRNNSTIPDDVIDLMRDLLLAAAPAPAESKDAQETQRLNLLIELGSTWHVQWEQRHGKAARYRMIDDGEAWGKWYSNPRDAIDAAIAAQKGETK